MFLTNATYLENFFRTLKKTDQNDPFNFRFIHFVLRHLSLLECSQTKRSHKDFLSLEICLLPNHAITLLNRIFCYYFCIITKQQNKENSKGNLFPRLKNIPRTRYTSVIIALAYNSILLLRNNVTQTLV